MGKLFHQTGLNGCLGSSDTTHAGMQSYPAWASINHKGFEMAIISRNHNATVKHYHQIMGTAFGHPGTWNDETLVLFDELIRGVYESKNFLVMNSNCMSWITTIKSLRSHAKEHGSLLMMGAWIFHALHYQ